LDVLAFVWSARWNARSVCQQVSKRERDRTVPRVGEPSNKKKKKKTPMLPSSHGYHGSQRGLIGASTAQ